MKIILIILCFAFLLPSISVEPTSLSLEIGTAYLQTLTEIKPEVKLRHPLLPLPGKKHSVIAW